MANNIAIAGRIFADPEYRETAGGKPVVTFKIPLYAGKKGDKYNPSQWYTIVAWDDLAHRCKGLLKGDNVIVYGYLTYREWAKRDGTVQGSHDLNAQWVEKGKEINPVEQGTDDFLSGDDDI